MKRASETFPAYQGPDYGGNAGLGPTTTAFPADMARPAPGRKDDMPYSFEPASPAGHDIRARKAPIASSGNDASADAEQNQITTGTGQPGQTAQSKPGQWKPPGTNR